VKQEELFTAQDFQSATAVSRETLARLETYAEYLTKWQKSINLVGPATLPDLWRRHMLDSAQLYPHLPQPVHRLIDMGSGAGFPGLVLAILGVPEVHLIESDSRKCAFLREVARVTKTPITIHNKRIESVDIPPADVVTARALAPLEMLFTMAFPRLASGGVCLFLKGRGSEDELTSAGKEWHMRVTRFSSQTDADGTILHIGELSRGRSGLE